MSKNEIELRKQAELRIWNDRIETLKQAGLMPELTESLVGLIQQHVLQLEEEKVSKQEDLPSPPVQVQPTGDDLQADLPKTQTAQQVQRENSPAPTSNPMLDFLADLPIPDAKPLPGLPQAAEQNKPTAIEAVKESTEPVPEAKPAIPSAAAPGTEPLLITEPVKPEPPSLSISQPATEAQSQPGPSLSIAAIDDRDEPIEPQRISEEAEHRSTTDTTATREGQAVSLVQMPAPPSPVQSAPIDDTQYSHTTAPEKPQDAGFEQSSSGSAVQASGLAQPEASPAPQPHQPNPESLLVIEKVSDNKSSEATSKPAELQKEPDTQQQKPQSQLSERREKLLQSKPEIPNGAMPPEMLERYRQIQASQVFRDDGRHKIGGGTLPNATPGGNQAAVYTQQDALGASAEAANSQLGELLERLAREHARLVVHIREANRILDESQY